MNIHMIGVGGIGMSALAQYYLAHGHAVTGSDRSASPTTELLGEKGLGVSISQDAANVPDNAELVVYSDSVPESDPERSRANELGFRQISYFAALGEVSSGATTVAVSGTHGKTTTTAMLTKILVDAGKRPTAIIGSIVRDFGSNFVDGDPNLFVVEGCEYKDHFLKLSPKVLIINNVEWDHTDWFKTEGAMVETFHKAALAVPKDGFIVADPSAPNIPAVLVGVRAAVVDYTKESSPELSLIGEFNKMNARAAKAAAKALFPELDEQKIDASLSSFKGSWRRFEYKGKTESGAEVYDDYAHHPGAVRATLEGARSRFPGKKITVAFHPHLYSRTRDLFQGFVDELAKADAVVLAPIYAAREVDDGSVSSDALAKEIKKINPSVVSLPNLDAVATELSAVPDGIIITMGAGDIYKVAEKIIA